jgi:ABC-type cobalt transport system substrate-binding protein
MDIRLWLESRIGEADHGSMAGWSGGRNGLCLHACVNVRFYMPMFSAVYAPHDGELASGIQLLGMHALYATMIIEHYQCSRKMLLVLSASTSQGPD